MTSVLVLSVGLIFASLAQAKGGATCTVTDESGKPVAKQEITLSSAGGKQSKKKTNDQGEVKFTGLDDGAYSIGADKSVPGRVEISGSADTPCKYTVIGADAANAKLQGVMQLVQQKKYDDAEKAAKEAVELMPGEATAHYVLAVAYAFQGNSLADGEIKKAAEISPEKFKDKVIAIQMQTLNFQADADKKSRHYDEAIKKYEAMLALSPSDPTVVYYNMGVTYALTKDYPKAIENMDKVLAIKPDDVEAKNMKDQFEKAFDQQLNQKLSK